VISIKTASWKTCFKVYQNMRKNVSQFGKNKSRHIIAGIGL
jgi:hypothetical protein